MTVLAVAVAVLLTTDASPGTYRVRTATCSQCDKDAVVKALIAPKSIDCGVGTERDFMRANKVFKCVLEKAKGKRPFHSVFERQTVDSVERFYLLKDAKGFLRFVQVTRAQCGDRITANLCKSFKKQDALYPACVKKGGKVEVLCSGAEVETFSDPKPLSELRCEWAGGDKGRKCKVGTGGVEPLPDQTVVCTPELKCDVAVKKP